MGQEWPGLRLPHHRPLLPHEKNYTDANSLYCLRGITSFKIRLDLVLFLFHNKEVRTFQNMVRNYKRKGARAKYSADNLQRCLGAVKTKEMSLRAASKQFGVPRATIQKRLKFSHLPEPCNLGRFKRTFTIEMENQLKQRVVEMEGIFYGMSTADLRLIAYDFAEINNVNHSFNRRQRMAGKDWMMNFIKRHHLAVRIPQSTSMNRVLAFEREKVDRFFSLLESIQSRTY